MRRSLSLALVGLLVTALGSACGDDAKKGGKDPFGQLGLKEDGGGDLKEFTQSPPSTVAGLVSAFGIESGMEGGVIAFYTGNRYFSGVVRKVGSVSYQIQATVGHYSEANGQIITRRKRTTCLSAMQRDPAPLTISGTTQGTGLLISRGVTSIYAARITNFQKPQTGFAITWGCFDPTTSQFTPSPWQQVP